MKDDIFKALGQHIETVLNEYGLVIACIIIGILIGYYFKMFVSDAKYMKQINLRLQEKDLRISQLNLIVSERLNKVTVETQDKSFFKKLKKYFKTFKLNK